jgi:iron complex transport system ATP-binding protein
VFQVTRNEGVVLLRLEELQFEYSSEFALGPISLHLPKGSFYALIGPNGCGKSTLVRLVSRLLKPSRGRILLGGKDVSTLSQRQLAGSMSVIPSENHFEFPFRVREVVEMGRFPHLGRLQRMSQSDHDLVTDSLRLTQTDHLAARRISELSSGERQRVLLARSITQQPELLVLDEPNTHLDIRHQISAFNQLRKLNREEGVTILVVLHDLTMAAAFADTIAVMKDGQLLTSGSPRSVISSEMIRSVYEADVTVHRNPEGMPLVDYGESRGTG